MKKLLFLAAGVVLAALWLLSKYLTPEARLLIAVIVIAFTIIILIAYGLPAFMLQQEKKNELKS